MPSYMHWFGQPAWFRQSLHFWHVLQLNGCMIVTGKAANSVTVNSMTPTRTGKLADHTATQAVSQVFQVLVPSVATTVASLSGSSASSTSNLSLTDATTIANTLDSAVKGAASSSASSASQVADEAVSGVLNAVSSLTNIFGRRLLQERRQLLQAANSTSTVRSCLHALDHQTKHAFCVRAAVLAF